MKINSTLSTDFFGVLDKYGAEQWLAQVDRHVGGLRWLPLGGIPNNVHAVEVMRDSGAALVERVTNSIDAMLDLAALEHDATAPTPHEAAAKWFGVPTGGLSMLGEADRLRLADNIRVANLDSGVQARPTVVIQDAGTGQHPDEFAATLLSLMGSNKKSKNHQMGVYNAGGAASYSFCEYTFIASRRATQLLNGKTDEVGLTVVRYNPLDPDKFKTGTYEYCVGPDALILRLDANELPDLPSGTYVKHIAYELTSYARGAHEPKRSLWHLFHAAVPDPALPFRIVETRTTYFPAMKGKVERRVVNGLLHLLRRKGIADYSEEASIALGASGRVVLRYFVLNDGVDPDAYTTSDQGLSFTLNGQRQDTRDRYWLKRMTGLNYIFKRLVVLIDGNGLKSGAKRQVFASTREASKDSPLTREILDLAIQHMKDDDDLRALDEQARTQTLSQASKSTSDKVKKQLASQIAHLLKGVTGGVKGGKRPIKPARPHGPPTPRTYDDSLMLDVPDKLEIISDPVRLTPGKLTSIRVRINAKNGFIPTYANALTVVIAPPLKEHVNVRSFGRLLGGQLRIVLETADSAPELDGTIQVALVEPSLGVLLSASAVACIRRTQTEPDDQAGGDPDVNITWHERAEWAKFDPPWDQDTAGNCVVTRDPANEDLITRVDWQLNRNFEAYEATVLKRKLEQAELQAFQERYEFPVCWGFFRQSQAEFSKEREADEEGKTSDVPDDYVRGERARLARAVLLALEPELSLNSS